VAVAAMTWALLISNLKNQANARSRPEKQTTETRTKNQDQSTKLKNPRPNPSSLISSHQLAAAKDVSLHRTQQVILVDAWLK
jgi:hypothetical protein